MDGLMIISPARILASSCIVCLLQMGVWLDFQASHSRRVAAGHARHSRLGEGASWHHSPPAPAHLRGTRHKGRLAGC